MQRPKPKNTTTPPDSTQITQLHMQLKSLVSGANRRAACRVDTSDAQKGHPMRHGDWKLLAALLATTVLMRLLWQTGGFVLALRF